MRHFIALLFSIFGVVTTVVVVIGINEAPPLKKRDLSSQKVSFSTPPPPKQIASKPKPKPKPKAAAAPPPVPIAMTGAGGLSFGLEGLRAENIDQLDDVIDQMMLSKSAVLCDIQVAKEENCFPMIPSGAAHYDMLLGPEDKQNKKVSKDGLALV